MLTDKIFSEVSSISRDLISKQQLETIREYEQNGGVAVWGTGRAGEYAINFCRNHGIQPVCVADSFSHEANSTFQGLPLLSSSDFFHKFPRSLVIIACLYTYGIDKLLEEKRHQYLTFDTNLLDLCRSGIPYQDIVVNESDKIEEVYTLLADDASKYVFEQIIKYRLSLDRDYIKDLNTQPIYFGNDVVPTFCGNTFVDCGAYIGDTLLSFCRSNCCSCDTYYALEPSQTIFERLKDCINSHAITNAAAMQVGAWDRKDVLRFVDFSNGASHISEAGSLEIQVNSLDNLFLDKNVDFIKMDIEGAERQALLGAKKIIQDRTPILSFSIYHKAHDLWNLPLLVREINPDYRFYIRHHSPFGDDTVLYAIPRG